MMRSANLTALVAFVENTSNEDLTAYHKDDGQDKDTGLGRRHITTPSH